ncbi:translation initiation factor IF-2, partial [Candidatus Uhrbacteria bacterium RIFCSPLOWO2_02_FULL_53_10]
MNVTELARRLKVPTKELLEKLPELGISLGKRAIKVNEKEAQNIMYAWRDYKRKELVQRKHREQQEKEERRKTRLEATSGKAIELPTVMSVREFAELLEVPLTEVMKELMTAGVFASINERLDFDTAAIVAGDLGFNVTNVDKHEEDAEQAGEVSRLEEVLSEAHGEDRAPVIVVMGHVDHGKTKLLDAIRETDVVATEAGGITQHIGAYQVERHNQMITFIDTPGHEAFTVMRSRGAQVADIAILVVAADDGVQPQTREAISIIKSAGIPMVVAINKIDKPEANIEKVKRELSELNLLTEDWGGTVQMVPISAKQGKNIDDLLDAVLLVYEVEKENIRANPNRAGIGTIIESHVDKGRGPVATVLIQSGTLKVGDTLGVRGANYGRVRSMRDYKSDEIASAGPSVPVQVLGWKVAPVVGDIMEVASAATLEKKAKSKMKSSSMKEMTSVLHAATADEEEGGKKILNIILKADVLGSVEAIMGLFDRIKDEAVGVRVVSKALGNVTEADVIRAAGTGAVVIGFHVNVPPAVQEAAREKRVEILTYDIIYKMFEDTVARLQSLMADDVEIEEVGRMEVLAFFKKLPDGFIAGGRIAKGKVTAGTSMRIWRHDELIGDGDIKEVRIGKEVVTDAVKNQEAGIQYTGKTKVEVGDILEIYRELHKGRKLIV